MIDFLKIQRITAYLFILFFIGFLASGALCITGITAFFYIQMFFLAAGLLTYFAKLALLPATLKQHGYKIG